MSPAFVPMNRDYGMQRMSDEMKKSKVQSRRGRKVGRVEKVEKWKDGIMEEHLPNDHCMTK